MLMHRGRREIAVEFFLLLGSQNRTDLLERLHEQVVALMAKVLLQLLHLETGVLHYAFDLMALRRGQLQFMIHPRDHVSAGNS